jgi:uncharacterized SAM-binding protein YcdF (DUF218 family)
MLSTLPPLDGLIVLGAKLNPEGRPGRIARLRLTHALACWQAQGSRPVLVLSGGPSRHPPGGRHSEARAMADLALAWGEEQGGPALRDLVASRLVLEEASLNTQASAHNTLPLVLALNLREVALVSDAFHIKRAYFLFRRHFRRHPVNLHPLPAPGAVSHYWRHRRYLWLTKMVLRESGAWLKTLARVLGRR